MSLIGGFIIAIRAVRRSAADGTPIWGQAINVASARPTTQSRQHGRRIRGVLTLSTLLAFDAKSLDLTLNR